MQDISSLYENDASKGKRVRNIIVLDDSQAQRKIISAYLKKWDYEVREAASGREALQFCREKCPDMILTDWLMPGMDGLSLCKAVRRMMGQQYVYLILLTSKNGSEDIARGLEAGADDFVTKPVNPSELRARMRAASRLLTTERELKVKNSLLSETNTLLSQTLDEIRTLYCAVNHDLREAADFQQSLLRDRMRYFEAGSVALALRSCGHVGGDMVGVFQVEPKYLGFYAIDVSGHGISSALMVARVAGYLTSASADQNIAYRQRKNGNYVLRNPAETVAHLNELVLNEMQTDHYFTLLLAILDVETGRVVMVQAGHPHPLVLREAGDIELVGEGGMPVGLLREASFQEIHITLNAGDRLLIYSDGLPEQPMGEGAMVGDNCLKDIVSKHRNTEPVRFLDAVIADVLQVSGHSAFEDDVSGVLLTYRPGARDTD